MSKVMPQEHPPKYADDITIRDYDLSRDFHSVAELLYNEGMFHPERDRYEQLKKLDGNVRMKVAVAMGERIVGSLYINGGIGVVEGVVVHPDFRRLGIGGRLVREAMNQLSREGHRYIELQVDDDRDDLKAWYESLGFERNYHVVGMMRPIEPTPCREAPQLEMDFLDRKTVNKAFMDLYMRYRDRTGYFAPLEPDYTSSLTHEEFEEAKRLNPTRTSNELMDAYVKGWFIRPPINGQRIYRMDWDHVDDIIKHSSLPALRSAYFFAREWDDVVPTPWIPFSSEGEGSEIEHVQCWLGRGSELAFPPERRSDFEGGGWLEDMLCTVPNDTFLFLRQVKGIQRFGCPPSLNGIKPDGDFLCYDRANENIFAFRIKNGLTEPLNSEETAIMQEEMVRYVRAYELLMRQPLQTGHFKRP